MNVNAKGKEVDKIAMVLVLHAGRVLAREGKGGTCILALEHLQMLGRVAVETFWA